jgi:hypothetical protein
MNTNPLSLRPVAADFILTPAVVFSVYNEGDVLYPKIAGVKIMGSAAEAGKAVATLDKGEELIYMGTEENGFVKVESGKGGGWVKKILVTK